MFSPSALVHGHALATFARCTCPAVAARGRNILVLKSLGRIINIYRISWRPEPGDHRTYNPITYMNLV